MVYYELSASGEVVHSTPINAPYSAMQHDFLVTKDYVVFLVLPLELNVDNIKKYGNILVYRPDALPSLVGVLPRKSTGDKIKWIPVDPCYVFHPMNAYDKDG